MLKSKIVKLHSTTSVKHIFRDFNAREAFFALIHTAVEHVFVNFDGLKTSFIISFRIVI